MKQRIAKNQLFFLLTAAFILAVSGLLHPFYHYSPGYLGRAYTNVLSQNDSDVENQHSQKHSSDQAPAADDFCPVCVGFLNSDMPVEQTVPEIPLLFIERILPYETIFISFHPFLKFGRGPPVLCV